ncbi:DNA-binding transcriptional regulator LsrR, DeoR family [Sedimentitalea nanhaiensis]|uniref:DNA-binding transcriptional regulator LsrR, DeoR family n=2 Tax=Sedimentitalea nanhaiensis TaxID=999627 RepID=A0A1I7BGE2_9RHOB|nr:DNA-binding transcriptional regulator LsrR, DeoR family [Sedimentitalea nanhaiensis]
MLYYREGLTQGEIARRMGVSRATIVNYLRQARDLGVVEIRIRGESFAASSLARRLAQRYGLTDAYVAHDDTTPLSPDTMQLRVAGLAASALCDILQPGDRLGVAWGHTVQHLATAFPISAVPGLTVYQMLGSMYSQHHFAAETCSIEIARKTSAECRTLHAPAVVSTPELADQLRREPIIARQIAEFAQLTKAVFAVGDVSPDTTLVAAGVCTLAELDDARGRGAVGVLCGHFIDRDGNGLDGPLRDRMLGISPETLQAVPVRMLVSSGRAKHDATRALLMGGHASHLVTDEASAQVLLSDWSDVNTA